MKSNTGDKGLGHGFNCTAVLGIVSRNIYIYCWIVTMLSIILLVQLENKEVARQSDFLSTAPDYRESHGTIVGNGLETEYVTSSGSLELIDV